MVICSVEWCERVANRRWMCSMHRRRLIKTWTTGPRKKSDYKQQKCKYCDRKIGEKGWWARGMCNRHYQNWLRHWDPLYTDKIKEQKGRTMTHWYYRGVSWRAEHIEIMENKIWRKLDKTECVHHLDLVKTNNSIENLYLCKNRAEHNALHKQLEEIAAELYRRWIIFFKDWNYWLNPL